ERRIIGLMSGTSLDGLDIALCKISGEGRNTSIVLEEFTTIEYAQPLASQIRSISQEETSLPALCSLNTQLGVLYAGWINECLKKWNIAATEIDLVASHGQTVYHRPRPDDTQSPSTLQIVDADLIARGTGIITVSDFRMKHIAAGGEGAPLAGYGDYLLFAENGVDVVMLNIGGISNFTCLPKNSDTQILCSDIGPGNTLIDSWQRKHFARAFDKDGEVAGAGRVNEALLAKLLDHTFFKLPFPKTTGPEEFNPEFVVESILSTVPGDVDKADVAATLTKLTAVSIAGAVKSILKTSPFKMYVSGGGAKNKTLMTMLKAELPTAIFSKTEEKGILPDAKEAVLFAILANECVAGNPKTFSGTGLLSVRMGKISFPD
ncbi:MAG: anhydro-N-acetylmuramic acid kinase, partial [Proteobacteria bacterium]